MQNVIANLHRGIVNLHYGFSSLQNDFAYLQNEIAGLQIGFVTLQNGFVALQNGFADLQNDFVSLLFGFANTQNLIFRPKTHFRPNEGQSNSEHKAQGPDVMLLQLMISSLYKDQPVQKGRCQ